MKTPDWEKWKQGGIQNAKPYENFNPCGAPPRWHNKGEFPEDLALAKGITAFGGAVSQTQSPAKLTKEEEEAVRKNLKDFADLSLIPLENPPQSTAPPPGSDQYQTGRPPRSYRDDLAICEAYKNYANLDLSAPPPRWNTWRLAKNAQDWAAYQAWHNKGEFPEDLALAKGIMIGLGLSSVAWITAIVVFWLLH